MCVCLCVGEMKRLSIAVEIAALPYLLCLDEPTSGLDSAIAAEVMKAVRALVDMNRSSKNSGSCSSCNNLSSKSSSSSSSSS